MEDNYMAESDREIRQQILCRVERADPGTDWENSGRLARLPGLEPDNISSHLKLFMRFFQVKNIWLGPILWQAHHLQGWGVL